MIPRAASGRPASIACTAASSISAMPASYCTGPSWRKSASRRRSSCSAAMICSTRPLALVVGDLVGHQSMIASRSAIATACVRVSASSLARMWRTWLFTVSWLMKSRAADVRVRHPVGEQLQDLALARGEHVVLVLAGQERRHQRRVDEALAAGDLLDRAQQRRVRRLLEDVALRARLEPAAEQRALAVGGEDQHRGLGHLLRDQLRRLEPVHARHADVHDHDLRAAPLGERDRAGAVGGLADDADVRRAREREAQPFAHDLVVVDDQAGDLVGHRGTSVLRGIGSQTASVSCSGSGGGASGVAAGGRGRRARAQARAPARAPGRPPRGAGRRARA